MLKNRRKNKRFVLRSRAASINNLKEINRKEARLYQAKFEAKKIISNVTSYLTQFI
jgi:hypothetical protein